LAKESGVAAAKPAVVARIATMVECIMFVVELVNKETCDEDIRFEGEEMDRRHRLVSLGMSERL
jgi:hypothetical protein